MKELSIDEEIQKLPKSLTPSEYRDKVQYILEAKINEIIRVMKLLEY